MNGEGLDRYDVEAMIRDAPYASASDLRYVEQDTRDLRAEVDELRGLLADLTEAMHALHVPTSTTGADVPSQPSVSS